jgi:hypothetical protein
MRLGSLAILLSFSLPLPVACWAQAAQKTLCLPVQAPPEETCPHTEKWTPNATELEAILAAHEQWVERWKAQSFSKEWADQNQGGRAILLQR